MRLVGRIEPVRGLDRVHPHDGIRKRHRAIRRNAADMVLVQVREQHFVDLRGRVAGRAQVVEQLAAAVAVQRAGARIDENPLRSGIDQERVDRPLHGRLQEGAIEIAPDLVLRDVAEHRVDRKRMSAVGQRDHREVADLLPIEAGGLPARGGHGSVGLHTGRRVGRHAGLRKCRRRQQARAPGHDQQTRRLRDARVPEQGLHVFSVTNRTRARPRMERPARHAMSRSLSGAMAKILSAA